MLVFQSDEIEPRGYTNSNFQYDKDSNWFTSSFVFTYGGAVVN